MPFSRCPVSLICHRAFTFDVLFLRLTCSGVSFDSLNFQVNTLAEGPSRHTLSFVSGTKYLSNCYSGVVIWSALKGAETQPEQNERSADDNALVLLYRSDFIFSKGFVIL